MCYVKNNILPILLSIVILACGLIAFPDKARAQETDPEIDVIYNDGGWERRHVALRIFSEFSFSAIFGALVGGAPVVIGAATHPYTFTGFPELWISAAIYPAAVASGTILGGWMSGGSGGYWEPFVGAYVGGIVADTIAFFAMDKVPTLSAIFCIAFPIIASIAAYEISDYLKQTDNHSTVDAKSKIFMPFSYSFAF